MADAVVDTAIALAEGRAPTKVDVKRAVRAAVGMDGLSGPSPLSFRLLKRLV